MDQEQTIRRLVSEMIESDRTVEDVCADHPELATDVRRLWRQTRAVEEQLEALFPSSSSLNESANAKTPDLSLPHIPGYEVLSVLGRGGMGVVYKARHLSLNRVVAIKAPLTGAYATASERERHIREARAVAALEHPNIITVHDVGEFEGRPYFTMEFIDGSHLGARLANTPQPARDAADMIATLADATECAHRAGVIHRDLKPANILLAPDGTPKIADFGLARQSGADATLTVAGFQFGTPSYMCPEQAGCRPGAQSASVDVYSLGAILYEMLTGRPPFRAENAVETLRQVLEDEPAAPSRLNPRTPRDLETICLTCLHKDPARRYLTAAALAEDLRRYLNGEPIRSRPVGAVERLYRAVRRRPLQAAAWLGTLAATGVLVGSTLWVMSHRIAIDHAVSEDLAKAVQLQVASDWRAARNTLERAKTRLTAGGGRNNRSLDQLATQIERELDLVDRVEAIRIERGATGGAGFDPHHWWTTYRNLFIETGLLRESEAAAAFGERIANSPIRTALIDAMGDWSTCAVDVDDLAWLLEATRAADPGSPWRDKARDIAVWKDAKAMATLAQEADIDRESAPLLLIVAGRMGEWDLSAGVRMLRRIQAAHPEDFWANYALASTLDKQNNADAIGFYRAAIAARPDAAGAHFNLAAVLDIHNRRDESMESYRKAISLDPSNWVSHYNLSRLLSRAERLDEALEEARLAAAVAPEEAMAHVAVAVALREFKRYSDAADVFKHAAALAPDGSELRASLTSAASECEAANAAQSPSQAP